MLYPTALRNFAYRLRLTIHVSFLRQKIVDVFIIHLVDNKCMLVVVSVHIYFAVLGTFYGCVL